MKLDFYEQCREDATALFRRGLYSLKPVEESTTGTKRLTPDERRAKESIDRISGSGVFARDPDSIFVMTRHEEESAFTVETTLRNFKPVEPFVVRWQFPLMRRADDLDPSNLKQSGPTNRRYKPDQIVSVLDGEMSAEKWSKIAISEFGMSRRTFFDLLDEANALNQIEKTPKRQWIRKQ